MNPWKDQTVLVTGACGTIGQELVAQLLASKVGHVIGVDNNESALFLLEQKHKHDPRARFYIGDIRDRDGSFEPQMIPKHPRHFNGIDGKILPLYAVANR